MTEDCIFCKIASGAVPSNLIYESTSVVAFEDLNPQAPVHVLIIPREHLATLNDLTDAHTTLIGELVMAAQQIAADKGLAQMGYRLVWNCLEAAGQSVFHIHLHLLGGRRMQWPPG